MSNRKRWANQEEAEKFFIESSLAGRTGLSFCAVCDYLGYSPRHRNDVSAETALYADWLLSRGISFIKEEIKNIQWELDLFNYVEGPVSREYYHSLEVYLRVAKEELSYLKKRRFKHRKR